LLGQSLISASASPTVRRPGSRSSSSCSRYPKARLPRTPLVPALNAIRLSTSTVLIWTWRRWMSLWLTPCLRLGPTQSTRPRSSAPSKTVGQTLQPAAALGPRRRIPGALGRRRRLAGPYLPRRWCRPHLHGRHPRRCGGIQIRPFGSIWVAHPDVKTSERGICACWRRKLLWRDGRRRTRRAHGRKRDRASWRRALGHRKILSSGFGPQSRCFASFRSGSSGRL